MTSYLPCEVVAVSNLTNLTASGTWDAIVVVEKHVNRELDAQFEKHRLDDEAFDKEVSVFKAVAPFDIRIVYAPLGDLDDFDDVRAYERAAGKGIARAIKAGAKNPVLVLPTIDYDAGGRYRFGALSTLLGAFHQLYVPIQLREDVPAKSQLIKTLGVFHNNATALNEILKAATVFERSRFIARDIGGGDPERMTPIRASEYVRHAFSNSKSIKITVIDDAKRFEKEYPLFQAVNRAAGTVPRHNGCIMFLEYTPPKPARKSLLLVGKGVTYDTGGADIKAGGVMAGMSRDKCGAAAVAGFLKLVEQRRPDDVHVIGVLCLVRNSVGEDAYVSDEVITSRSGVRVRIGNTDAEGRMCMSDALSEMKDRALSLPDPHLFTVATLTGHAWLAAGAGYSFAMDNGPARNEGHAERLKKNGDLIGEPFEVSTIQREDFAAHQGVCLGEDVVQANNLPSSKTPRGHQTPAAFIMMASGLVNHGSNSAKPIKFTHLDIAGSAGDHPWTPTGAPILALAETHLN